MENEMVNSKEYFAEVAGEWDEIRSGFFTAAMRDAAIRKVALPTGAVVADVGTGTGFVLRGLLEQAEELVGFDESPQMLDVARGNFAAYPHVHFRQAEGQHLPQEDNTFDAVFANMYLHHAPDPAAAIVEMVRVLKPGGKLVITDLDTHEEAWMRQTMSDRWLGFARQDMQTWYKSAGLTNIDIDCAAGTCDCSGPDNNDISLRIFVAIGQK
jgi:ubiquinone/menaquinone biosynthesis C-methylase UbiE